MKRLRNILFLLSAFLLLKVHNCAAQEFNYKVNAMYIYYFTKYINWPPSDENITIGVIGDSNVAAELENITNNKKSFTIRKIDISEAKKCKVIVVAKDQSHLLRQLEEATKNLPILIVTERAGLVSKGAGICIYVDDEDNFKTKFQLSKGNIQSRGLKISHELIALAEVIN